MKLRYYDPMFCLCSEKMPFTIRLEVNFKDPVKETPLDDAVQTAIRRYPYFAVRVEEEDGELITLPNDRPIAVYPGPGVRPLGSDAVNRHLVAFSYCGNTVNVFVSHVITDGAGFYPFLKTVFYYYISLRYGVTPDPAGIRLVDSPFLPDELGNPFPEEQMKDARPLYECPDREYFSLRDGGFVTDDERTMFRIRVPEGDIMRFSHDNDGSPCALVSSLMAKAVWAVHPDVTRDLVSAVSFNLRPGLGNRNSYRMLCNALRLRYPAKLRSADTSTLCTCSRGMVTVQSQPENVLWYAEQTRARLEALGSLDLAARKAILGEAALADACDNTFSVSYVGKPGIDALEPYLDSIYNVTDGSTYKTAFLEISAVGGSFDIAFLQGFSSDVYYRAFLAELARNGLAFTEEGRSPMDAPGIVLP